MTEVERVVRKREKKKYLFTVKFHTGCHPTCPLLSLHADLSVCVCVGVQGAGLYCGTGLGLFWTCQRSLNGASCLNNREQGARLVQVTEIGSGVETGQRDRSDVCGCV